MFAITEDEIIWNLFGMDTNIYYDKALVHSQLYILLNYVSANYDRKVRDQLVVLIVFTPYLILTLFIFSFKEACLTYAFECFFFNFLCVANGYCNAYTNMVVIQNSLKEQNWLHEDGYIEWLTGYGLSSSTMAIS